MHIKRFGLLILLLTLAGGCLVIKNSFNPPDSPAAPAQPSLPKKGMTSAAALEVASGTMKGAVLTPPASVESRRNVEDMFSSAKRALLSNNSHEKYEGYVNVRECLGLMKSTALFEFSSGATNVGIHGRLTPERQIAVAALQRECAGFYKAGNVETMAMAKKLYDQGAQVKNSAFSLPAYAQDMPPNDLLISIVEGQNAAELEAAHTIIVMKWLYAAGISMDPKEQEYAEYGAWQALCSLGKDCSPGSFASNVQCAYSGECGLEVYETASLHLTPEEEAKISKYRRTYVNLVQSKNIKSLGLVR